MPRSVRKPPATRRTAPPRPCSSASRNPRRRIEAWRLLDSVRRRFVDDVPVAVQEECFHAFNLCVHDVVLDAHLQVLIRHASKMEEGGRELLPWFLFALAATDNGRKRSKS